MIPQNEQQSQDNLQDLILESQHTKYTKSTETNQLLGMILEVLAKEDRMPELNLELLNKVSDKLEEIKNKLSEPIEIELEINA